MTSPNDRQRSVYARYLPINRVSVIEVQQMYRIFESYYAHTDLDTFLRDMSKKSGVILIRTRGDHQVVGFSTIVNMAMPIGRLQSRGVFSGDTIVEKAYWGSRALHLAFYRYIIWQKIRKPFTPLFWLLISKGYKTYLLLANNFERYYPHPEHRCPELFPVVRTYCDSLFPGHYDPDREILDFGQQAQRLKEGVAAVTDELARRHDKIRFFAERNPSWQQGTELPCVGVVTLGNLLSWPFKKWLKERQTPALTPASERQ